MRRVDAPDDRRVPEGSGSSWEIALVSVIVPVRNGVGVIGDQLAALAAQTYDGTFEIIVADNGSADETRELVESWCRRLPNLRLVGALDGAGANVARNVGARYAEGELLLFCDADDIVSPSWISEMAIAAADCEIVGGRLDDGLNDPVLRSWRTVGGQDSLPTFGAFLPYAMTANCGIRRDVYEQLNGFDESYPHGCDDVEFCWRAQLASFRLCFVPDAVVYYRYRRELRGLVRQFYDYGRWAPTLFRQFEKHGMPPSGVSEGLRAWWMLARRAPRMLPHRTTRGRWAAMAALRLGRTVGSIRERVIYL